MTERKPCKSNFFKFVEEYQLIVNDNTYFILLFANVRLKSVVREKSHFEILARKYYCIFNRDFQQQYNSLRQMHLSCLLLKNEFKFRF